MLKLFQRTWSSCNRMLACFCGWKYCVGLCRGIWHTLTPCWSCFRKPATSSIKCQHIFVVGNAVSCCVSVCQMPRHTQTQHFQPWKHVNIMLKMFQVPSNNFNRVSVCARCPDTSRHSISSHKNICWCLVEIWSCCRLPEMASTRCQCVSQMPWHKLTQHFQPQQHDNTLRSCIRSNETAVTWCQCVSDILTQPDSIFNHKKTSTLY